MFLAEPRKKVIGQEISVYSYVCEYLFKFVFLMTSTVLKNQCTRKHEEENRLSAIPLPRANHCSYLVCLFPCICVCVHIYIYKCIHKLKVYICIYKVKLGFKKTHLFFR